MDVWYFAYGSNLLRSQMVRRTGPLQVAPWQPRVARLEGYQVVFNKFGSNGLDIYANIVSPGPGVWGAIYRCTPDVLAALDGFEIGYTHLPVRVADTLGNLFDAIAYVATPENTVEQGTPTDAYLQRIIVGAREFDLPPEYILSILRQAGRNDDWIAAKHL